MDDLIEAFQIFTKYVEKDSYSYKYPTNCGVHDLMIVTAMDKKDIVSEKDIKRLDELGFEWSDEHECFVSFHFGSS